MPLKVLLLTHRIPYPLQDGGAIVTNFMISGFLQHGVQLSLLSLNTSKHFVDINTLPKQYQALHYFETVYIDNKITPIGAFSNYLGAESYHTSRFKSAILNEKLKLVLQENNFDIVILDNIFLQDTIATIRQYSKAKMACRIHNIEHLIWEKLAHNTKNWIKKKYLVEQAQRLKEIELKTLQQVDVLLLLNENEGVSLQAMGVETAQYLMPFGIDIAENNSAIQWSANTCFHLASMDWLPNVEALDWFLQKIFPKVLQKKPNYILHIGGKYLPNAYIKWQDKNIIVHQSVENGQWFMQVHGVCIVPLLSGAGIRVKVLEAMSLGVPVISTSLGASGLQVQHGVDILLANTPHEFADALLTNEMLLQKIGQQAKQTVLQHYNKTKIIQEATLFLSKFANA